MSDVVTKLRLPDAYKGAKHALTSVPWPADRKDIPTASGVKSQVVSLFDPNAQPRLRRYLLLTEAEGELPQTLEIQAKERPLDSSTPPAKGFSSVEVKTLRENLDRKACSYVWRECEARISVAGKEIGLRMGLLPNVHAGDKLNEYSWWQWSRAERVWSGELAEAWRIGGHLVPYTIDAPGMWKSSDLGVLGNELNELCGDILHGDVYIVIWRSGVIQLNAHFKSAYFHTWPKEIPAFPVIYLGGLDESAIDFSPCHLMLDGSQRVRKLEDAIVVQPWTDLKFLANRDREKKLHYLPPEKDDVFPAGVSRAVWFNIGLGGADTRIARYQVPAAWYHQTGLLETSHAGPGAQMAARNVEAIKECTQLGGIDTGRVWRYLMRSEKLKRIEEDGAEWEGNLAQGMFMLAYQREESPENWEIYLHHAYHAADVSVYHGAWMGRLECTAAMSAPLPKFRFGGFLYAYLETGDPYLLEVARAVAGVFMAMEWALEPRIAIGRDAYPLTCMMSLWDYTADQLYLDFAKQMATRLLSTQQPDGGFSGQAGAGVLTGVSCRPGVRDIHFGCGILSPFAFLEWAIRDKRWPDDFIEHVRRWADLMLAQQKPDGHWYVEGKSNEPYHLTGSGTMFTLVKAGEILKDPKCLDAVRRYLTAMNQKKAYVLGTHSFLSCQYAHVADAALEAGK